MNDKRYTTLCDFINHAQATSVQAIMADALTISAEQYPDVKYIVVDPSCSGSGMDRFEIRDTDERSLKARLKKLNSLQSMILGHALSNFPNVQKVIYSTCSIYQEENESVVYEVLKKVGDTFSLVNLKKKLKNEWLSFASSEYDFDGNKCLYALPETDFCKGFFLAMFRRKSKNLEKGVDQETMNDVSDLQADIKEEVEESYEMTNSSKFDDKSVHQRNKKCKTENANDSNNFSKCKKRKSTANEIKSSNDVNGITSVDYVEEFNETAEIPVKKKKKEKSKSNLGMEE